MLNLLWKLVEDESDVESRVLAGMVKEHPELPEWSAAVQPLLARLLRHNDIKRPLVCRVLTMRPPGRSTRRSSCNAGSISRWWRIELPYTPSKAPSGNDR